MKYFKLIYSHLKLPGLILIIFLAVIIFINIGLHQLLKIESIRKEIISTVFEKTQSNINIESIEILLLPSPHIAVYTGNIKYEANFKVICDFKSIDIYPKLVPLLKGNFEFKQISINNPELSIKLPQERTKTTIPVNIESPFLYYSEKYYQDLITVASKWPDIEVLIKNGDLVVFDDDKTILQLEKAKANYKFNKNLITVNFSSKSEFADFIKLNATISKTSKKASLDINFSGLEPQNFSSFIFKDPNHGIAESNVDLAADIEIDGIRNISGDISSPNFNLNLIIKDKIVNFKGRDLEGNFYISDDKKLFSVSKVNLNSPMLKLSGDLLIDKKNEKNTINIKGHDVDVETTRNISLFIFEQYNITKKIFQIVNSGEFESIDFLAESKNLDEIFREENFKISGNMKNGEIFVPKFDLRFNNVKGNASIINGVLYGNNLFGNIGGFSGNE